MSGTTSTSSDGLVLVDATNGITVIPQLSEQRRLNWFDGKLLRADDLRVEQDHVRGLVRRTNSAGGRGVVHGLTCALAGDGRLHVGPGVAIDPGGRSLVLPVAAPLDVGELIAATAGAGGVAGTAPAAIQAHAMSTTSLRATKLGTRPVRTGFAECVAPGDAGQPTIGTGRWYVITVGWAEGLCGSEEVYGRLCEDACSASTDRPWRMDGLVFRARPTVPRQAFAASSAVVLDARHERSLLASALFADEREDTGSMIGGGGLRSGVWCSGAAAGTPAYDEVPIGVLARSGDVTTFLDVWTARRERIEPPPQRYWAGRMAMRPWDVFLAQILQFQCQLGDVLETGKAAPAPGRPDPCAERQRVLEQAVAELANRPVARLAAEGLDDDDGHDAILELLQKQMVALRLADGGFIAARRRVLVDGGIVELPPAGYLPVDPAGVQTVEAQVQALLGAGVALTFCTTRADAVARELEDAQHLDRISLLRGIDDPGRREEVDIIVPDGEIEAALALEAWRGKLEIRVSSQLPNAGASFDGAGRVQTAGALALRWAGEAALPAQRLARKLALTRDDDDAPPTGDDGPEGAAAAKAAEEVELADAQADAQAAVAEKAWAAAATGIEGARSGARAEEEKALTLESAALDAAIDAAKAGAAPADAAAEVERARDRVGVADARVDSAHDADRNRDDAIAARRVAIAQQRKAIAGERLQIALERAGASIEDAVALEGRPAAWLDATIDRDPLSLGIGDEMTIAVDGDMTAPSGRGLQLTLQSSFDGAFTLTDAIRREDLVQLRGTVSGTANLRVISATGSDETQSATLSAVPAEIRSGLTSDGATTVTMRVAITDDSVLTATLTWHGAADGVELIVQLAEKASTAKTVNLVRAADDPATGFGTELGRLTLDRDATAGTTGDPARVASESALQRLERALGRPGYAAAAILKLFPALEGGRLRAPHDWVLFRRRAILRCGPLPAPPEVKPQTFAVYGLGLPKLERMAPPPQRLGELAFNEGVATPVGANQALTDAWATLAGDGELASILVAADAPGGDALALRRAKALADTLTTVTPLSPRFAISTVAALPVDKGTSDGVMLVRAAPPEQIQTVAVAVLFAKSREAASGYVSNLEHGRLEMALARLMAADDRPLREQILFDGESADAIPLEQLAGLLNTYKNTTAGPVELLHVLSSTARPEAGNATVRRARGKAIATALGSPQARPVLFEGDEPDFQPARDENIDEATIVVVVPRRDG